MSNSTLAGNPWLVGIGALLLGFALAALYFDTQQPSPGNASEVQSAIRPKPGEAEALRPAPVHADEILSAIRAQQDAWNAGDLEGFMRYYEDDLTFYSGGDILKGRAALTSRYRKRYQTDGKEMGKLTFSDLDAQVIDLTNAVARGRFKVEMKDGSTPQGLFTLVMTRRPDGWKIAHDHTSAAEPPKKP